MKAIKIPSFYIRSSIFGALSLSAAIINYSLYPVLVRVLNTASFGDFAVVIALSNQVMGVLLAFNIISIHIVKTNNETEAKEKAEIIQKILIRIFICLSLILVAASPFLHKVLHVNNIVSFFVLGLILITAVPAIVWTGYLQGNKKLIHVGIYNIVAAILKLVLTVLLAMNFGTIGAIWGVYLSGLSSLIVLKLISGNILPDLRGIFNKIVDKDLVYIKSLRTYLIQCLIVVGGLSFLQNFDITLAKSIFSPEVAGSYGGISILSNALYYLSFLLVWIVLPEIKIDDDRVNRRLLSTGYKLLTAIAVLSISGEYMFRNIITRILLGNEYASLGSVLIFASIYQLLLVSISLYSFYLLINKRQNSSFVVISVVVSCLSIVFIKPSSPLFMIELLCLALFVGFSLAMLVYSSIPKRRSRPFLSKD